MDDIELLKLEMKALRIQNQRQNDELKILRRYRKLIERSTQIAGGVVVDDEPLTTFLAAH